MAQRFEIKIEPSILEDLKDRLQKTRWPDEVPNKDWSTGTNRNFLRELCDYWRTEFDWAAQEVRINAFDHYKSKIGDLDLHFIHQKSGADGAIPLLLIHGWPDSFVRFMDVIPLLIKPDEGCVFDVVVPSIPGYGFSEAAHEKGMDPKHIGNLFHKLMTDELGYEKYFVHGGDWGSSITEQMGLYHGDHIEAIHLTDVPFAHSMKQPDDASAAEKKYYEEMQLWMKTEGAYAQIQGTKPQTLAYGLNDSPAGLAGWIMEKFKTWTDNHGNPYDAIKKDTLLTNLTVYWATNTIGSSVRLYYEAMQTIMNAMYNPLVKLNPFDKTNDKVKVPAAFALYPKDIHTPPKEYAERFFDVRRWRKMSEGGHFAALEEPETFAQDLKEAFFEIKESIKGN